MKRNHSNLQPGCEYVRGLNDYLKARIDLLPPTIASDIIAMFPYGTPVIYRRVNEENKEETWHRGIVRHYINYRESRSRQACSSGLVLEKKSKEKEVNLFGEEPMRFSIENMPMESVTVFGFRFPFAQKESNILYDEEKIARDAILFLTLLFNRAHVEGQIPLVPIEIVLLIVDHYLDNFFPMLSLTKPDPQALFFGKNKVLFTKVSPGEKKLLGNRYKYRLIAEDIQKLTKREKDDLESEEKDLICAEFKEFLYKY